MAEIPRATSVYTRCRFIIRKLEKRRQYCKGDIGVGSKPEKRLVWANVYSASQTHLVSLGADGPDILETIVRFLQSKPLPLQYQSVGEVSKKIRIFFVKYVPNMYSPMGSAH